jgi:hypothetical protein
LQALIQQLSTGWPDQKSKLKDITLSAYWNFRDQIYMSEGLVFRKKQLIVPKLLRKILLQNIHLDHCGVVKALAKAREVIYWPGMSNDIKKVVESCYQCQSRTKAQIKEPMISASLPQYLFQRIAVDYCEAIGRMFLVTVDAYSHWINIYPVGGTDCLTLFPILMRHFAEQGTP